MLRLCPRARSTTHTSTFRTHSHVAPGSLFVEQPWTVVGAVALCAASILSGRCRGGMPPQTGLNWAALARRPHLPGACRIPRARAAVSSAVVSELGPGSCPCSFVSPLAAPFHAAAKICAQIVGLWRPFLRVCDVAPCLFFVFSSFHSRCVAAVLLCLCLHQCLSPLFADAPVPQGPVLPPPRPPHPPQASSSSACVCVCVRVCVSFVFVGMEASPSKKHTKKTDLVVGDLQRCSRIFCIDLPFSALPFLLLCFCFCFSFWLQRWQ